MGETLQLRKEFIRKKHTAEILEEFPVLAIEGEVCISEWYATIDIIIITNFILYSCGLSYLGSKGVPKNPQYRHRKPAQDLFWSKENQICCIL